MVYGFVLAGALLLSAFQYCRRQRFTWSQVGRFGLQALVLFCVIQSLLWAGGILNLTLLRTPVFFAYMTLARSWAYGTGSLTSVWAARFAVSPAEWITAGSAAAWLVCRAFARRRRAKPSPYYCSPPFAMLALLLLLITINNRSDSPRFIAPFVPLAAILTAIALHDLLSAYPKVAAWLRGDSANHRLFRPTMAQPIDWATQTVSRLFTLAPIAIAALLLWNLRHFQTKAAYTLTTFDQVVALCRSEFSGHNLVVPQVYAPTLRWYLQPSRVRGYIDLRQALRNSQEIKLGIVVIPAIQILEWQQTSANTSTLKTALSQFGLVAIEL